MSNIRKFALVVFDFEDNIIDRINIDNTIEPKGLGIKLKLNTINTDIEDVITKVNSEKQKVQFKVIHTAGYLASSVFAQWIEKYSTIEYSMALEYTDRLHTRYCEGKVISLSKEELNEFHVLERNLVFQPVTAFFTKVERVIKIKVSSIGKSYPFRYPYSYGKNVIENNEINNTFITDIPLIVKIYGGINNPIVQLLDESGTSYNRVEFSDLTIAEGQYLLINSSKKKIWLWNGSEYIDYTPEVNPSYDSYLMAKHGKSTISINLEVTDSGELIGGWRQYGIDS